MTPKPSRLLRRALTANLLFSLACAAVLLWDVQRVAAAMGGLPVWFLTFIGFGLIGFGGLIFWTLRNLRLGLGLLISVLDLMWVLSTLPLTLWPDLLTPQGKIIVLGVAGMVALFGVLQLLGIRAVLMDGATGSERYRHCVRLRTSASAENIWPVIRDLGGISRHTTALAASRLEGGETAAPGAVRVCTNPQGQSWAEEVVALDDDTRTVVLRFKAEAEDFPLPLKSMSGGWQVFEHEAGAMVDVWWTIEPHAKRFGWLVVALMTVPLDRNIREILASMTAKASGHISNEPRPRPALSYC